LDGIDPGSLGLDARIDDEYYDNLKVYLVNNVGSLSASVRDIWRSLQRLIPEDLEHNLYDSKTFFEWLRKLEIPAEGRLLRMRSRVVRKYVPRKIEKKGRALYRVTRRKLAGAS
jgi:hypothetical protein